MKQPNFLYIITDQQRADYLGCAGHPILQTPNIDRLADEGVRCDRFYCNNPVCTPSRAAIITGRCPRSNRVYDNGCVLPESETTLPQVLADSGYRTGAIGKLHLSCWHHDNGRSLDAYDYWRDVKTDSEPEPYYGFQHTEICLGHVSQNVGHYARWLAEHHPDILATYSDYLKPHPSGAPEVSLWDMPEEAHVNSWIIERTNAFLNDAQHGDQPFFLHVGFPDPHHPFRVPEPWGSRYNAEDMTLRAPSMEPLHAKPPEYMDYMHGTLNKETLGAGDFNTDDMTQYTDADLKQIQATTCGMISFIDHAVGRILHTLEETGQLENTVIVFTSDHGDLMGDHRMIRKGPFMQEGLVRVPFIIRGPKWFAGDRQTDALAQHTDFFPTALDLAGIECPRGVEGRSLMPLLRGDKQTHRQRVLVEFLHQFMIDRNVKALITDDWKLVQWGGQAYGELYDLKNDPLETVNHWDQADAAAPRNRLTSEMLDELLQTENTLPWPVGTA